MAATSIRGFVPERVALPITFEYDSTDFDAKGQAAAADLLDFLTHQGQQEITLLGHTDPRGDDAYNLALSQRRAEAVQRFLQANHYSVSDPYRGTRRIVATDGGGRSPGVFGGRAVSPGSAGGTAPERASGSRTMTATTGRRRGQALTAGLLLGARCRFTRATAETLALVVGIDQYRYKPALKGAVNDARAIRAALEAAGVRDIVLLLDDQATREAIRDAWNRQVAKAQPGDTLIFTYAGHGGQEPNWIPGNEADGKDETLVLGGFRGKPGWATASASWTTNSTSGFAPPGVST